jgi:hypothetical protein
MMAMERFAMNAFDWKKIMLSVGPKAYLYYILGITIVCSSLVFRVASINNCGRQET